MSKFDTNGGYFAPKDYLKVNEGGSHEENPNGGVQIGVDPEGTPNLLEEGEPVYKDYVYSDNIEAEKEFLEQNNLPGKYAGKLYSKIADDLFSEAEERPLDPISRNGLEALLGRLADAQEGQKQAKEQRDLEDELANLSPEELDQLEAMLAQGEQEQMAPEQMPMGAAPEQMMEPAEPMPVEGMPMMGLGGYINSYPDGGWLDFLKRLNAYTGSSGRSNAKRHYAIDRNAEFWNGLTGKDVEGGELYDPFTQYVLSHAEGENADPMVMEYFRALDKVINKDQGVPLLIDPNTGKLNSNWRTLFTDRRTDGDLGAYHLNPDADFWTVMSAANVESAPSSRASSLPPVSGPLFDFSTGTAYTPEGANLGLPNFSLKPPVSLPQNDGIGYPHGVLFDIDTNTAYRPDDASLGLPDFKFHIPQSAFEADTRFRLGRGDTRPFNEVYENTVVDFADRNPDSTSDDSEDLNTGYSHGALPVWPRYAGAVGSGLLGLYNAFQSPDRYTATRINPQVPEGRINLQNQVYNPVDQNMVANAQIAQGNATNRALRNSGLGPSSAAAILAADNNTTGNLGTGFLQTWDANNQRRNAVIAANNQAEAQRANFDYTVDATRKEAFNRFAPYNAQNDLMVQRLNNQAEADKYTAISNQISNGLQALSGIGQENFAMNQVNSNPAFIGYGTGPNGWMQYNPYYQFWLENKDKVKK